MSASSSYFINIIPACSPFTCRFPTSIHILGITKIAVSSIWCLSVSMRRNKDFFKYLPNMISIPGPVHPRVPTSIHILGITILQFALFGVCLSPWVDIKLNICQYNFNPQPVHPSSANLSPVTNEHGLRIWSSGPQGVIQF